MSAGRAAGLGAMVVAAMLAVSGCYWLRYSEIARTHADLLDRLATDARDAVVMGHRLSNSDIETMRYPLQRAEEFALTSDQDEPPASLLALRATITAYREELDLLDRLRIEEVSEGNRDRVDALARKVAESARKTRAALEDE